MTKTLTQHLQAIKDSKQGIFVPYIMAGDHERGLDGLFDTIQLLEESGASAIEVGIPWSDPVADGPVIEMAGQRSLAKGVTLTAIVKKLQEQETKIPLVIMTYINPVYQYGIEAFIKELASTSVKGLIIPDLPNEHADMIAPYLEGSDIALVPLVSLTTGIERQKALIQEDIQRFNQVSDGVIVGSKIVRDLHEGKTSDVKAFVDHGSHFNKC